MFCGFEGILVDMYLCGCSRATEMQLHFSKKIGHVSNDFMVKGLKFLEAAKDENLVGLKQYLGY